MSQSDLAATADVGLAVVIRAEMSAHMPMLTRRDSAASSRCLKALASSSFNRMAAQA